MLCGGFEASCGQTVGRSVMMAPELYVSIYKEQFRPPGRVKRAELRPTSAHRRNNPQPRPDFLFPRPLQSNYRQARSLVHPLTSVAPSRPLFPPVTHSSLLNRTNETLSNPENAGKLQSLPSVNGNSAQEAPSSGRLRTRHPMEPPAEIQFKSILRTNDNQRNAALELRQKAGSQIQTRPQTSYLPAASRCFQRAQRKCCSNGTLDYSGCNSCFHVVRPYQVGYYSIHPEFVSESLY